VHVIVVYIVAATASGSDIGIDIGSSYSYLGVVDFEHVAEEVVAGQLDSFLRHNTDDIGRKAADYCVSVFECARVLNCANTQTES
jgi:hypothetical protein